MYTINFNNGITEVASTLEEAMEKADDMAAYTTENITIESGWETVAIRRWCGIAYDAVAMEEADIAEKNPIVFGDFGYYSDWEIL